MTLKYYKCEKDLKTFPRCGLSVQFWRQGTCWMSARGHVTPTLRQVVSVHTVCTINYRLCKKAVCRLVLFRRLACFLIPILEGDRRLRWFLAVETLLSYRHFTCKCSDSSQSSLFLWENSKPTDKCAFILTLVINPLYAVFEQIQYLSWLIFSFLLAVQSVKETFIRDSSLQCGTLTLQQGTCWESCSLWLVLMTMGPTWKN